MQVYGDNREEVLHAREINKGCSWLVEYIIAFGKYDQLSSI